MTEAHQMAATGYSQGRAFPLLLEEVECGHYMSAAVAAQVREAIRAGRDDGLTISIDSAFRTYQQQKRLHDGWKEGLPGFNPADPPGYSKHQQGRAIDVACASAEERERLAAIAVAHGATRPIPHEPWHLVFTPQSKELA